MRDILTELLDNLRRLFKDVTNDSDAARAFRSLDKNVQQILADMFVDMSTDAAEKLSTIKAAGMLDKINTTNEGGVTYKLMAFAKDGRKYVDVQVDQNLFDGLSVPEMNALAKKIIREKFAGKVIGIDNRTFVNGDSVHEYIYPSKAITSDIREAKLRAAPELDNLIDAGTNFRNSPDGADGHHHPNAVGGFDYFDTIFKVGNEYYYGLVNIEVLKKGKRLKDITKIRNITKDIISSYGHNPKSDFLRDVSMDSIRNPEEKVKQISTTDSDYMDAAYMRAVDSWDKETEQKLVDQAAVDAGAILGEDGKPLKLYRGTLGGQTTFAKSDTYGGKIYTIDNINVATRYGDKSGEATEIRHQTEGEKTTYALYGFPKKMLTIDAQYGVWSDLAIPEELLKYADGRYKATNAEIADWAEQEGYDALRIDNVRDGSFDHGTEIIFFNENTVKSADPVTYGNDGKAIPLSERFNEGKNDLRYKTAAEDVSEEGYDTTNLHWAIENDIISKEDQAVFWTAIADISKRRHKNLARTKNGAYIIETPNVMMFTDADFKAPTLSKVILFPYGEYVNTEEARIRIRNEARIYGTTDQSVTAIENMLGPGYVTQYFARNFSDYGGQISRGTRANGGGVDSQSGSRGVRHGRESGLYTGSEVDNKISGSEDLSDAAILSHVSGENLTPGQKHNLQVYRERLAKVEEQKNAFFAASAPFCIFSLKAAISLDRARKREYNPFCDTSVAKYIRRR